jgi:hypothetical protein
MAALAQNSLHYYTLVSKSIRVSQAELSDSRREITAVPVLDFLLRRVTMGFYSSMDISAFRFDGAAASHGRDCGECRKYRHDENGKTESRTQKICGVAGKPEV